MYYRCLNVFYFDYCNKENKASILYLTLTVVKECSMQHVSDNVQTLHLNYLDNCFLSCWTSEYITLAQVS